MKNYLWTLIYQKTIQWFWRSYMLIKRPNRKIITENLWSFFLILTDFYFKNNRHPLPATYNAPPRYYAYFSILIFLLEKLSHLFDRTRFKIFFRLWVKFVISTKEENFDDRFELNFVFTGRFEKFIFRTIKFDHNTLIFVLQSIKNRPNVSWSHHKITF